MADTHELHTLAHRARAEALRAIHSAGSGHPGGSLSVADLLAFLYRRKYRGPEPGSRIVLSKGHACPLQYAILSLLDRLPGRELTALRRLGSPLQGHPHCGCLPEVETSTGSLGQGFSVALGIALGLRHQGLTDDVFAILGDGELQEGSVWEAAMCAAHHGLNRLWAVIDYNGLQSDAPLAETLGIEPLIDKWRAFGWRVVEIDGHDFAQMAVFDDPDPERPTAVIARTVKGCGVPFMENAPQWHGSVKLSDRDLKLALIALRDDARASGEGIEP